MVLGTMAAWLNLISIIVFCCDRTSGFTRLTWLVITQCIEWQQIKFHGGHFSGLYFALSTSNMPILIMILNRFLIYHMPHIYIPLGEFTWNVLEMNNSFRNDHFSQNLITWSFSKNSLNSRTSLLSIQSCLENELFSAFRLNYFKNLLCSPFLKNFCQRNMN